MQKLDIAQIRGALAHAEFARLLGVSVRTVLDWEQGRKIPNAAAITLLRKVESGQLPRQRR